MDNTDNKVNEIEKVDEPEKKIIKMSDFIQKFKMNNFFDRSKPKYNDLIWNSIETADEQMIDYLHSKVYDTYLKKINILYNLLYSTEKLPIKTKADVIKFFNIISPLNNEFNLGSYNWSFKHVDKRLYIHNSLLKVDLNFNFKVYFLNPIKRVLKLSGVNFKYYEFKSMRYYRSVDIVFVVDF